MVRDTAETVFGCACGAAGGDSRRGSSKGKGSGTLSWQPQRSRQQLLVMSASPVKFRHRGITVSVNTTGEIDS